MPVGEYTARVVEHGAGESRTGTPYIGVKFSYGSAPNAHTIIAYIYITPKRLKWARQELRACGLDPDLPDFGKILSDQPNFARGHEVQIVIAEEEYAGKISERVVQIGSGAPAALPKKKIKSIVDALRGAKSQRRAAADAHDPEPPEYGEPMPPEGDDGGTGEYPF